MKAVIMAKENTDAGTGAKCHVLAINRC